MTGLAVTPATGRRRVVTADGACLELSAAELAGRVRSLEERGFWLDIEAPGDDDYRLLRDTFRFHPLTIEDIQQQNQRPKLEEYRDYAFAVIFTVVRKDEGLEMREHHLYLSPNHLITVHREPAPALDQVRERIGSAPDLTLGKAAFLSYLVLDVLVDSLFPVIDEIDEEVDQLQDRLLDHATHGDLAEITRFKHDVTDLRRFLGAERDLFQRIVSHAVGAGDPELPLYYRDLYDHLVRQYEMVDSLRDLLTGALDVYLSTVSNRLNSTMKALTVIASVFLPLTFLTGFFGMNFATLVASIGSPRALAAGLSVMSISVVVQLYLFRRRGWL